jgi:hypothetical protein
MAELDRRLRLAVSRAGAGPEGQVPTGRGVEETVMAETLEGAMLAEPDAAADAVVSPEELAAGEPEILPVVGGDGAPAGSAADELPPVEELAKRLRPEVLAALDELFRAKWTGVKRLRPGDLKTGL